MGVNRNFVGQVFVASVMRRLLDSFGEVLRAMWTHKLRSFLTMFGIAWGVGSLLLLVGLGEGFRAGTAKGMASFGEDFMQIYNGRVPALGGSQLSSRQYYLNYQDYLDIRNSGFVRNATGHPEKWEAIEIDRSLDGRDCAVAYKKGGRTLAVVTISRDLQSLQAEAAMEAEIRPRRREVA